MGDSTVTDGAGWGLGFKQFLNPEKAELINTAQGGRSSMSFMNEGRWTNALALKADYYLIQFGHNNQPGKPGRSTDMPTYESNLVQYVEEARAAGATPILVTPLTRRQWQKDNPRKINPGLQPWADVVKKVAAERNVPLVDLHARSIELCESFGPKGCEFFSPIKGTNASGKLTYDGTHLNSKGWVMFARLVVGELEKNAPELLPYLRDEPISANPVARESKFDAVVSFDGSGTHTTVQEAIAAAPTNASKPFTILIKPGKYQGQIIIPKEKSRIRFVGEDVQNTVLTYPFNVFETNSQSGNFKGIGVLVQGNDFSAENITFENTSGDHGQALALRVTGDRAVLNHCRMLGWQDTMRLDDGRQYLTNCYIEGRVDFIYGSGTAVFDHCELHSKNGGFVTAANTPRDKRFGFVFFDCRLTGDPTPWVNPTNTGAVSKSEKRPLADLGRPWRGYASVAYIRCEMGDHISSKGWNNWGNVTNETTARYVEYGSTGPGANPNKRVKWSRQLGSAEARALTPGNILGGVDGWEPKVNWED
ncbi:MAG TPA: pectinesterase family protein [Verrucomicrobiae bacterium]